MNKPVEVNTYSIGPIGLMWVVLFALKIMEVITWHWLIVIFFPILAVLGILLVGCIFGAIGFCIYKLAAWCREADILQAKRKAAH